MGALLLPLLLSGLAASQPPRKLQGSNSPQLKQGTHGTQVVLGTGTPGADPDRSGPATAVVVNGSAYLVDFGPGVVRRAKTAVMNAAARSL